MHLFRHVPAPILTPCIGICRIVANGFCEGCHRSLDEIANWAALPPAERQRLMYDVLLRRAEQPAP